MLGFDGLVVGAEKLVDLGVGDVGELEKMHCRLDLEAMTLRAGALREERMKMVRIQVATATPVAAAVLEAYGNRLVLRQHLHTSHVHCVEEVLKITTPSSLIHTKSSRTDWSLDTDILDRLVLLGLDGGRALHGGAEFALLGLLGTNEHDGCFISLGAMRSRK